MIKVFYTPEMVASCDSFSPSSSKPKLVVESWIGHGFDIDIIEPTPATLEQLYRAHNKAYVDGVLACRIPNGFGNKSKAVADSLIYTSALAGGCLVASRQNRLVKDICMTFQ